MANSCANNCNLHLTTSVAYFMPLLNKHIKRERKKRETASVNIFNNKQYKQNATFMNSLLKRTQTQIHTHIYLLKSKYTRKKKTKTNFIGWEQDFKIPVTDF